MKRHLILRDLSKLDYYSTEFSLIVDVTRLYLLTFFVVVTDYDPF